MIEIDALPPGMRGLDTLLTDIGWDNVELARRLGVSKATVSDWRTGRRSTPLAVLGWLERVARAIHACPVPRDWTPRGPGRPPAA